MTLQTSQPKLILGTKELGRMPEIEPSKDGAQIYGVVFTMKRHDLFLFDLHHPKRKLEL